MQIQGMSDTGFRAQPFHTLSGNQTGASPLWVSHRNTCLVSWRPKIWALEAPPTGPLSAPPCQVQGNNPRQIQTSGSGVGKYTHHLPWSLKDTSHGRSRSPVPLFLPDAFSEIVGSTNSQFASRQADRCRQKQTLWCLGMFADPPLDPVLINTRFAE